MKRYFSVFIWLFIVDRLTKVYFITKAVSKAEGGLFHLQINPNIAFSLPLPTIIIYILVAIILAVLLLVWRKSYFQKSVMIWPWGLIIIGAVSNVLDRLQYGGVIDFINVPYFTVLNISDLYISAGVIWALWLQLKFDPVNVSARQNRHGARRDSDHV